MRRALPPRILILLRLFLKEHECQRSLANSTPEVERPQ
jgi:hypothetical protein